jgi:membrane-bound lytic murein transglycosylase B
MPSTFHKYAIDFDKNDKINLFDRSDALASGANYLKNAGWNNKLLWGEKININLTDNLKKMSKNKKFQKQKFWKNHGVFLKNQYNKDVLFRLIIPDLEENHFFLVTRNFDVILDWNRSNYFALTVFLLSNEIQD